MIGFGRNASPIWAADATGGVPKITNPGVAGMAGAASSAICPPRLQPTTTASPASVAAAKAARTFA